MNIEELIKDYKRQTKICSECVSSDEHSVVKNNDAVNRMDEIVDLISERNNQSEIYIFSKLLKHTEYRTHIWSAIHLLKRLSINEKTEKEALKIIEKEAKGNTRKAIRYKHWLKEYKSK